MAVLRSGQGFPGLLEPRGGEIELRTYETIFILDPDLPEEEVRRILTTKPRALEILPELPLEKPAPKKRAPAKKTPVKRKRARKADGTLKGDDPSTPDINEAWEDGKHLN